MTAGVALLADIGSPDVWSVAGRRLAAALGSSGQSSRTGEVVAGPLGEAWGIAPDEVLLAGAASDAVAGLRAAGALVTSIGPGLVHLRLSGPAAGSVLEAACPVDLSERAFAPGSLVQAMLAGMRAIVIREAQPEPVPSYRIVVQRDLAVSLREALIHLGAQETVA